MISKEASKELTVYVASPLGFSDAGRYYLKEYVLPKLAALGINIIDPWSSTINMSSQMLRGSSKTMTLEEAMSLGGANEESIRKANVVLAVLDGTDVDSGVSGEIGFARGLGKKIIGYRGDFRLASDGPSCYVNLQIETFIRKSGGEIYETIEEAINELSRMNDALLKS